MQLLKGTRWGIRPTGTITGAGAGPGSKAAGRVAEQVIGKRNETRLDRPLGRPVHCAGRNRVGILAHSTFSRHVRNGASRTGV